MLKEKNFINCHSVNIFMKIESSIEINNVKDYKKTDIKVYHHIIKKLMYLLFGIKFDIAFAIR